MKQLRGWAGATVVLGAHLCELPPPERAPFVRAVADGPAEPVVD